MGLADTGRPDEQQTLVDDRKRVGEIAGLLDGADQLVIWVGDER